MITPDERWIDPNGSCSLCRRPKRPEEHWGEEHWTMGGSGFNFSFCPECETNDRVGCDKVATDVLWAWKQKCREYWDTHPKELAEHNKRTEEYRKSIGYGESKWLVVRLFSKLRKKLGL